MAQWLLLSCCFRDLSIWLKIRIPYTQSHKSATIELLSIHLISAPTACNKQRIFTSHVMQSENEWRKWCYETMFVLCWPMPPRAPNIIHFLMHSKARRLHIRELRDQAWTVLVSLFVMYVYKFICIIGKCFFFLRDRQVFQFPFMSLNLTLVQRSE